MNLNNLKLRFQIRKATKKDLNTIQKQRTLFNMPHSETFVIQRENKPQVGFVAISGKKIIGFITIQIEPNNNLVITNLYNRIGFERKGIGSKLIGKVNEYAIRIGAKKIRLYPGSGYHLVNGKKEFSTPNDFYENKTNYKFEKKKKSINGLEVTIENFIWKVKRKQVLRKAKAKISQQKGLAPQNLMRKDNLIRRRK